MVVVCGTIFGNIEKLPDWRRRKKIGVVVDIYPLVIVVCGKFCGGGEIWGVEGRSKKYNKTKTKQKHWAG